MFSVQWHLGRSPYISCLLVCYCVFLPSSSWVAGKKKPYTTLLQWGTFLCRRHGGRREKILVVSGRNSQPAPNTPEFAQPRLSKVKRRSFPARGYKFGCVCSYMAGIIQVWGYKFGCVCSVPFRPHFALLKRGCANSGGFGARWDSGVILPGVVFAKGCEFLSGSRVWWGVVFLWNVRKRGRGWAGWGVGRVGGVGGVG